MDTSQVHFRCTTMGTPCLFVCFVLFFIFLPFLGLLLQHVEVSRLGVESEL